MPQCEFCGKFLQKGNANQPARNSWLNHLRDSSDCNDAHTEKMSKKKRDFTMVLKSGN